MELFEHRYYRLSKKFMTLLGQWPYQSTSARCGFLAIIIFVSTTAMVPAMLGIVKYYDERRLLLECVSGCLLGVLCFIKLIGIVVNSEKILILLNRIYTNWQVWARLREVNILHKYAKQGEKMIIVYTAAIYLTGIIFTTQPIIPKIIDVILRNGTEAGLFPYPFDYYYFDAQKYYWYVMIHTYICVCVGMLPVVASDGMLIIYVQHICGIFAALRHKSKQIGHNDASAENVVELRLLIERHNDSIEYAKLIEALYTWNFFFTIGLGTIQSNLVGLQILIRTTNDPESIIRFIVYLLSLGFVLFAEFYICQILMDHSINVGLYIYNSQWYRLLPSDRKSLQLIILRCRKPCHVTAGKMLIMSISNFGMTLRTSMSYFAVIRSMNNASNIA